MMVDLKVQPPEIDGYRYDRHLGTGGYSEVFVYEHLQLGREVAVKVLTQGASEDEARVMAQLAAHTHIVDVYSVGETASGLAYLVMQLYSGPTFAQRLRSGPLRIAEVLQVGVQLCGALEWAHRLGVLHRDIKPANILTSSTGRPGLADFGISTSGGSQTEQTGVSLPWVPPEVLEGHAPDELADVYSLAATLYTLLEGHAPFVIPGGDNSDQALVRRTLGQQAPPLSRVDASPALTSLLRSALSRSPSGRPSSAEAFGRALQSVEAELRLAQTSLEVAVTVAEPVDRTDEDATRVRGVRVIDPEAGDDRTRARGGLDGASRPDDATRHAAQGRPEMLSVPPDPSASPSPGLRRTVTAPDVLSADDAWVAAADPVATTSARRRPLMATGAIVLLVAAAVVIAAIGGRGTDGADEADDEGAFATEATLPSFVPVVTELTARREGESVIVGWAPPEGVGEFAVRRCDDGADPGSSQVSDATVTFEGVPASAAVCVGVTALDDGAASDEQRLTLAAGAASAP